MYGENVEKAITNLDVYIHSDLSTWTTDGDYVITDIKHLCPDKVVKLIEYSDML